MKKLNYLCYFAFFVLLACNPKEEIAKLVTIDVEVAKQNPVSFTMDDFIGEVEYVPLENHPDGLIGQIGSIIPIENFWVTKGFKQEVFLFERNGKFVRQIGGFGKGPGEYGEYADFFVIQESGEIILHNQATKQLIFYNTKGKFIRSIKLPHFFSTFEQISDTQFLGHTTHPATDEEQLSQYMLVDVYGEMKYLTVPEEIDYQKVDGPLNISICSTTFGAFLSPALSDTIYRIENNQIEPWLVVDLGSNRVPKQVFYEIMTYYEDLRKYSFVSTIEGCAGKWLLLTIHINGEWPKILIDLENVEEYHYFEKKTDNFYGITNDLDGGPSWSGNDPMMENQYFSCNSVSYLKRIVEEENFPNLKVKWPEKKKEFYDWVSVLKEEDNPVVQILTVKQNINK